MKVRALGEMRVSARPLTIFCSSHPLPLPNALRPGHFFNANFAAVNAAYCSNCCLTHGRRFVLDGFGRDFLHIVDRGELQDFEFALAVGG